MDNTVKCRPPPMGLFLLIDRRRLKAFGLSWASDPVLNQEHTDHGLIGSACDLLGIPLLNQIR